MSDEEYSNPRAAGHEEESSEPMSAHSGPPTTEPNTEQMPGEDRSGQTPTVKREASPTDSTYQLSLKVVNAEGAEVFFKIRRQTQLRKLMDAYCKKQGMARTSVRFLYDGNLIAEDSTPEDLSMEDDDVIDAMVEQIGGMNYM
mmetsp:Transcript_1711/g.2319  ORF Transcript_1711/g.2319 Transcript_1711/m.2319 type:complete len:143 (+) Transcript_1711:45-473(+)